MLKKLRSNGAFSICNQIQTKNPNPFPIGKIWFGFFWFGAGGGGRTRTVSLPTDFESASSANSDIPAITSIFYHKNSWLSIPYFIKLVFYDDYRYRRAVGAVDKRHLHHGEAVAVNSGEVLQQRVTLLKACLSAVVDYQRHYTAAF